jgi:hypothetical protein
MLTSDSLLRDDRLQLTGPLLSSSLDFSHPPPLSLSPTSPSSFILEARCEYFQIMFGSGMAESSAVNEDSVSGGGMVDIVVPDSFVGLLRFLIYLYTDILPDGSDGALLEDLMSADRYQVLVH